MYSCYVGMEDNKRFLFKKIIIITTIIIIINVITVRILVSLEYSM